MHLHQKNKNNLQILVNRILKFKVISTFPLGYSNIIFEVIFPRFTIISINEYSQKEKN